VADQAWQAEQFERHRAHLEAVAYRMLGSANEAEDAVQEAWLRLSQSEDEAIANLGGWLTTVLGRVCLDMLRARRSRRECYIGSWEPERAADVARHTVTGERIVAIDLVLDPARLRAYVVED